MDEERETPGRLRLLICTPRFAPQLGGAETWTREITRGLLARGHEPAVIARAVPGRPPRERVRGIDVARIGGSRLGFARALARRIRSERPDAVLAQYSALPAAMVASRKAAVPCVGIVHDVYGVRESVRIKGPITGVARTLGLEQWQRLTPPDAFLVPSRATGARLARLVRGRPITVVPAGADHLGEPLAVTRDGRRLVFVGRLVPQKGVADIVEAAKLLRGRGLTCEVVIVGDGPARASLNGRARALGRSIRFAGPLPDAELDHLIAGSLALLLPSRREGWGLAVTEAASRGTPYVAYDIPAVREQHEQLQGGLLVDPGAPALAAGIERLLEDPALARRLGGRGQAAAATMTWARAAEVVERAIATAVDSARAGRGVR